MELYNTPDHKVIKLDLNTNKPVNIYSCGPTVYDYPHIGNWYTFIRYDLLNRVLTTFGYKTKWIMNITDVGHLVSDADEGEDKLEKGAKREGKTAWEVAEYYTEYFKDRLKRLNFSEISQLPKASDYIKEQIAIISLLEEKNYTYKTSDGIYFDTSKFPHYAEFARLNLSKQEEGARVKVNSEKRNTSDFALWKFSPIEQSRFMEWDSPWGIGFPGWHLECSAMIHAILCEPIDIHAGGTDHIPIHHTNEIAQSEAAFDTKLSKYWMHCNHILVDGKKMSKSLGNFYTLEDIESKGYSLEVFRLHVLSGHYRSQSEFSWESLEGTKNRLQNWIDGACLRHQPIDDEGDDESSLIESWIDDLEEAILDDLNTPQLMSQIDSVLNSNLQISDWEVDSITNYIRLIDSLLGTHILELSEDIPEDIKKLILDREKARIDKDWSRSDEIRDILLQKNITLRDAENGTVWSRRV